MGNVTLTSSYSHYDGFVKTPADIPDPSGNFNS